MGGHTNRNRRNGGNPRSRHGPPRQRGSEGRAAQPRNDAAPAQEPEAPASERKPERENNRPFKGSQPLAQSTPPPDSSSPAQPPEQPPIPNDTVTPGEPKKTVERPETSQPRGRPPFAAASRGGHAYIPASGPRPGMNGESGQNGQNGHHRAVSANGHAPLEPRADPPILGNDDDSDDSAGDILKTWRIERLNGGADSTPREPSRPESRGDVGALVDSLHELFAHDRAVASQSDSVRCGICYLHFPVQALEYREAEGFYVCSGCKRSLGRQQLRMIRRQQLSNGG